MNSQMVQRKNVHENNNKGNVAKCEKLVNLSNEFPEFFVLFFHIFVSLTLFQNKKFLKINSL